MTSNQVTMLAAGLGLIGAGMVAGTIFGSVIALLVSVLLLILIR